ncbi:MAG TPA: hypothetical protein VKD89_06335 [Candidatus Udaeobacter sp.]|nr:hypothetical protein [Candidatus Udaeobacter sp.]
MLNPNVLREMAPYKKTGALIDTSLLLLLFVGSYARDLIQDFKRTQQYSEQDFDIIAELAQFFHPVATTPNILTEVSNFCGQLPGGIHRDVFENFRQQVYVLTEIYVPSREASDIEEFCFLRLTDSGIAIAAERGLLVITVDFELSNRLAAKSFPVINFNHLRSIL